MPRNQNNEKINMVRIPTNPAELTDYLLQAYPTLSKRLQQVARFALDNPNDMALETIAVIANRASVQPSTVIRFAKAFGYSGFKDMQRVYQARLTQNSLSYSERIRLFREENASKSGSADRATEILREFCAANIISLEHVPDSVDPQTLSKAVELLVSAEAVNVLAVRRGFPVAWYFTYMLGHLDCPVHLLDGSGGMLREQANAIRSAQVLVAISFRPYASETADIAAMAASREVSVVAITDSRLSPLAKIANVCLEVKDPELHGFRSLTASMCMVQSLAVGVGLELEARRA